MLRHENKIWHDLQDKSFDGLQEMADQKADLQVQLAEALASNVDLTRENLELSIMLEETHQRAIDRMKQVNEKMASLCGSASSRGSRIFPQE